MNELLDKLVVRLIFALLILAAIYFFKLIHIFFFHKQKKVFSSKLDLGKNSAESIYFLTRIMAIAMALNAITIQLGVGLPTAMISALAQGSIISIFFILGIYIIGSFDLFSFEYQDEVIQRKNICYALLVATHNLCFCFILRKIFILSQGALITLAFLFALSLIVYGSFCRVYRIFNKRIDRYIHEKSISSTISYIGYLISISIILVHSLDFPVFSIERYLIQFVLQLFLCLLIFPFFYFFLRAISKVEIIPFSNILEETPLQQTGNSPYLPSIEDQGPILAVGIFEATFHISCAYLTVIITNNINFDFIYTLS